MKSKGKNENKSKIISWLVFLGIWSAASYGEIISPLSVPQPHEVVLSLLNMFFNPNPVLSPSGYIVHNPSIWPHIWGTAWRTTLGVFLGGLFGIPLGILIGSFRFFQKLVEPPLNFFRAIPMTALFPLFMLCFGIWNSPKVAMIAFGSGLIMVVGAAEGIKNAPKEIIDAARLDGADELQLIDYITGHLALPHIYANVKVAISIGLILAIVGEMTIGSSGIGSFIKDAYWAYRIPEMWAGIIVAGMLGVFINQMLERLRPRLMPWVE